MDDTVGNVYVTNDYSKFKFFEENREVTKARANKIIKSMRDNGIITNPILVNEKMEIIDGQGRLTALRELGAPVHYIVLKNVGARECRTLNASMTNWITEDFIKSYALSGNSSYCYLQQLSDKFSDLPVLAIMDFLQQLNTSQSIQKSVVMNGCSSITDAIRNAGIDLTQQLYDSSVPYLEAIVDIIHAIYAVGNTGTKRYLVKAIGFCLLTKKCDTKRLIENINRYGRNYTFNCTTMGAIIEELTRVYNYNRTKKQCVYFDYLYKIRDLEDK